MQIIPREKFTIHTTESLPVVRERLAAIVSPRNHRRAPTGSLYQGTVSPEGFDLCRVITYRNSALPVIRGQFEALAQGTAIHISMGIHPFVVGFLAFWFLSWYSAVVPIFFLQKSSGIGLMFLLMPALFLLTLWLSFRFETQRSRQELTQILLGQVATEKLVQDRNRAERKLKIYAVVIAVGVMVSVNFSGVFQTSREPDSKFQMLGNDTNPCLTEKTKSSDCNYILSPVITGHPSATALAISPDNHTLISGGSDKALKVWDITSGKLQRTLQSNSGAIRAVAISPDGKIAATGSGDHMARIWDLSTGKQLALLKGHTDDVTAIAIRPSDRTVVSGSWDGTIKIWDITTGQLKTTYDTSHQVTSNIGPVAIEHGSRASLLDLSLDGNTALVAYDNDQLAVWNLTTGKISTVLEEGFEFLPGSVMAGSISPHGDYGVIQYRTYNHGGKINLWDLHTGKIITSQNFTGSSISAVPITINGDRVFGASHKQLQIWNLKTKMTTAAINSGGMEKMQVSADGKMVAGIAYGQDSSQTLLKIWHQ